MKLLKYITTRICEESSDLLVVSSALHSLCGCVTCCSKTFIHRSLYSDLDWKSGNTVSVASQRFQDFTSPNHEWLRMSQWQPIWLQQKWYWNKQSTLWTSLDTVLLTLAISVQVSENFWSSCIRSQDLWSFLEAQEPPGTRQSSMKDATASPQRRQALVRQALEHNNVFVFGELLECPNVQVRLCHKFIALEQIHSNSLCHNISHITFILHYNDL